MTPTVALGDQVAAGDTVAKIEAMKMEASITITITITTAVTRPAPGSLSIACLT